MSWFKVDDGFYSSRKVTMIPRSERWAAIGLWTLAGAWCAKELTDGFIPDYQLEELGGTPEDAASLVMAGLWLRVAGGHQYLNWGEYQPTRAEIEESREKERERKRKWREAQELKNLSRGTDAGQDEGHQQASGHPDPTRPDPTNIKDIGSSEGKRISNADIERAFDKAYSAWPKKVERAKSFEKFKALAKVMDVDALVADIVRFGESYARSTETKFVPALVVWLNGKRWEDELPDAQSKPMYITHAPAPEGKRYAVDILDVEVF